MQRLRLLMVVAVFAAGLLAVAPQPKAHALPGFYASADWYKIHLRVQPAKVGYELTLQILNCDSTVKLKSEEFTFTGKLKTADVVASTACGDVNLHWEATGHLTPYAAGAYRPAFASGTVSGVYRTTGETWAWAELGIGVV